MKRDCDQDTPRLIPLPDVEPISFQIYQQWLCSGLISSHPGEREQDREYELLVRAYSIGEKFEDADFQDTLTDAIISRVLHTISFDVRLTHLVYASTAPDSPLRRLWLDVYYYSGNLDWVDEQLVEGGINAEFLYDYCRWQVSRRNTSCSHDMPYISNPCHYHHHSDWKCYRDRRLLVYLPAANVNTPLLLPSFSETTSGGSVEITEKNVSAQQPIKLEDEGKGN